MPTPPANGSILPLRLDRVGFAAGGQALIREVTLELGPGPRTLVVGPNGAGKSLLLRLCHGLLRPSAGRITWGGDAAGEAARRQAMVFQRPVLLRRSAAANVRYALALSKVPRGQRAAIVADALAMAGLGALAGRPARVLSGGEQQRLALARAWALGPEVLFLDEPTASLDPAATRAVEEVIRRIAGAGSKIVMTTHDLGQARRLADEVVFLHAGRVVDHAPAPAFFERP
ncbi:MAG: ATP-binding cassette domain-containing protein, partial [Kiloniellales bacterium]